MRNKSLLLIVLIGWLFGINSVLNADDRLLNTDKANFVDIRNNKAVFSVDIGGGYPELFIANKDGTNQQRITFTPQIGEVKPKWLNDEEIAYIAGNNIFFKYYKIPYEYEKDKEAKFFKIKIGEANKREITKEEYESLEINK